MVSDKRKARIIKMLGCNATPSIIAEALACEAQRATRCAASGTVAVTPECPTSCKGCASCDPLDLAGMDAMQGDN